MTPRKNGLTSGTQDRIDSFLDEQLVENNAPGASVAIFDSDGILYETAIGARNLDPVEPATTDSPFHIASVTKSFTAIAIMQFVERGDLELDDPVWDYVECLNDVPGEPITVGDLLTHTSGIPSDAGRPGGRIATRSDLFRRFDRWGEVRLTDRDRLMYLNRGYVVLGAVVETLADRPYAEHVSNTVLEPMGMDQSTFDPDAIKDNPDAMEGYVTGEGEDLKPASTDIAEFPAIREGLYGVGGLISTVTDLAAIGPLLLNGGSVRDQQVLEPETVTAMTRPQSPPAPTIEGVDLHFGIGWLLEDLLDDTLIYGGGGVPGYSTFVGVLEEHDLGVALGINKSGLPKVDIGQGILALACGESPTETVRWFQARRLVAAVSGTYESARTGDTLTVKPAGDGALRTKIAVTFDSSDLTFQAAPEETTGNAVVFSTRMGHGLRWTVEFQDDGEDQIMLWRRGHRGIRFDAV